MPQSELRIGVEDADELDEAKQLAEAEDLSVQEASGGSGGLEPEVEPITMLIIGGGVLAAAKFITGWLDKRRGGLVIDQRDGAKDDLHRDRDVPWGYVVIYPKDGGAVTIETHDEPKDAIERLIAKVISGSLSTVAELAKIAKEELSDDSKVKTDESAGG